MKELDWSTGSFALASEKDITLFYGTSIELVPCDYDVIATKGKGEIYYLAYLPQHHQFVLFKPPQALLKAVKVNYRRLLTLFIGELDNQIYLSKDPTIYPELTDVKIFNQSEAFQAAIKRIQSKHRPKFFITFYFGDSNNHDGKLTRVQVTADRSDLTISELTELCEARGNGDMTALLNNLAKTGVIERVEYRTCYKSLKIESGGS